MSNVFNESSNKSDILDILKSRATDNSSERPIELLMMPQGVRNLPDELTTFKAAEATSYARELKLPIFIPREIPHNVETKIWGKINNVLVEGAVNNDDEDHSKAKSVVRPIPMGDRSYIPKYVPRYTIINSNVKLYKQIWYQYIQLPSETKPHFKSLMAELTDSIYNTVMCSGTWKGQLYRLKQGWDTKLGREGLNKSKDLLESFAHLATDYETPLEKYATVMEKYMPISLSSEYMPEQGGFPGLFVRPSYFCGIYDSGDKEGELWSYLPKISNEKMAGPPYLNKYKDQVLLEAFVLADTFYANVSKSLASAYNPATGTQNKPSERYKESLDAMTTLIRNFWYLSANFMFPKIERYDWEKVLKGTKTRNIFAQSFPTYLLQGFIMDPVLDLAPNVTIDENIPSMYGVTFFHGGMDKVINKLLEPGESNTLIYADNLYISWWNEETKSHNYYSIDLVKGESQTSPRDLMAMNYYLLTRGHIDQNNRPMFSLTWAYTALKILPFFQADNPAIWSSMQLKVPGMASGVKLTYCGNAARSSVFAYHWSRGWDRNGVVVPKECRPGTDDWNTLCKEVGINWQIEKEILNFEAEIDRCKREAPNVGYLQADINAPSREPGVHLDLDLLGYGATWSRQLNAFVPVLSRDRLLNALVAPQRDAERPVTAEAAKLGMAQKRGISNSMYKLVMAETYRLAGGWFYAPIDAALQVYANDARSELIKQNLLQDPALLEALKLTEHAHQLDEEDIESLLPTGMVNNDLININLPRGIDPSSRNSKKGAMYEVFREMSVLRTENKELKTFNKAQFWKNKISVFLHSEITEWVRNKYMVDLNAEDMLPEQAIRELKGSTLERKAFVEFNTLSKFMDEDNEQVVIQNKVFSNKVPDRYVYDLATLIKATGAGIKVSDLKTGDLLKLNPKNLGKEAIALGPMMIKNQKTTNVASYLPESVKVSVGTITQRGNLKKMTLQEALKEDIRTFDLSDEDLAVLEAYYRADPAQRQTMRDENNYSLIDFFSSLEDDYRKRRLRIPKSYDAPIDISTQAVALLGSAHYITYKNSLIGLASAFKKGETALTSELYTFAQEGIEIKNETTLKDLDKAASQLNTIADQIGKVVESKPRPNRSISAKGPKFLTVNQLKDLAKDRSSFEEHAKEVRESNLPWTKTYYISVSKVASSSDIYLPKKVP